MTLDPFERKFTQSDLLQALPGLTGNVLQAWIHRGRLAFLGFQRDLGPGARRYYSVVDAALIGIVHGLAALKVNPEYGALHAELAQTHVHALADSLHGQAAQEPIRAPLTIAVSYRLGDEEAIISPGDLSVRLEDKEAQFWLLIDVDAIYRDVYSVFSKLLKG